MSNLEFVKSLEGQARKVVVRCYVQGFMYTYGKLDASTLKSRLLANGHLLRIVMSLVCATLATLVGLVIKEHKI